MKIHHHERVNGTAFPAQPPATQAFLSQVGLAQRVIAVYDDHAKAEQTIRRLAEAGFPEDRATVVGRGLSFAERGTGRLSTAEVCGRGAASGLIVGALIGWVLDLFDLVTSSVSSWWLVFNAAVLGAVLGAATVLVGYAATRGQRSFTTSPTLTAGHYDVQVDADLADRAARILNSEQRPPTQDADG